MPKSGNAYVGLVTVALPTFIDTREFLTQTMKYDLSADEEYYFECWVSPFDNLRRVCHNIGITFTEDQQLLECVVDCPIYVENDSGNPLTDKALWTKVSGTFVANGGERVIHIGNFRPDSLSEMEWVSGGSTDTVEWWDRPYYYIDDVWLSHVDSMGYVGSPPAPQRGEFKVWPNPARDVVRLEVQSSDFESLSHQLKGVMVADVMGREIHRCALNDRVLKLDVGSWENGVYMVNLWDDKGTVRRQKLIVQQ